jgi:integrase
MNPQTPSHWLRQWLKENDLQHITFHGLRHTHITLLIANGVDIATVSNRAGHNKISTTLDNYTRATMSRDTAAADMLDDMIMSKFAPNTKQRKRLISDQATPNSLLPTKQRTL